MASLATIFRQVEREGPRWGLFPVMRDGKVSVCELVYELPERPRGCFVIPRKTPRVVCSLDESSGLDGFSAVLMHRLHRQHHDFMKLVNRRRDRLRAIEMRELQLRRRDLRAKIEAAAIRRRIMSLPAIGR